MHAELLALLSPIALTYIMIHTPCRTPLHCAVAYSNLDMIRYLIGHGASLFLKTREGETPAKIGMEEYRLQQESQGGRTNDTTVECLKYLTGTNE